METIKFFKKHSYSPSTDIEIPIELRLNDSRSVRIRAKVDTGASFCIFQREYGEALKLNIEAGVEEKVRTADGGHFHVFGHSVTMTCLGWNIDSMVYFAKEDTFRRNVVGQRGWLEQFKLGLIHHDSLIFLSRYDD